MFGLAETAAVAIDIMGDAYPELARNHDFISGVVQREEERFPPLKTISNTNLPRPASSFVGRERETAEVAELVRRHRFVTLSGPSIAAYGIFQFLWVWNDLLMALIFFFSAGFMSVRTLQL